MVNRSGVPWPVTPKQGDGVQPKAPPKIVTLVDDGDVTFLLNDFKSARPKKTRRDSANLAKSKDASSEEKTSNEESAHGKAGGADGKVPEPSSVEKTERSDTLEASEHPLHIVTSSKVICAASPVFRKMIHGEHFAEAGFFKEHGWLKHALEDVEDPMVFLMMMFLLHGRPAGIRFTRTRAPQLSAPRYTFEQELGIAQAANRWDCAAALREHAREWFASQEDDLYGGDPVELLPLVWMAWLYRLPSVYEQVTMIAQRESTHPLDEDNPFELMLPSDIINAIEESRLAAIRGIFALYSNEIAAVRANTTHWVGQLLSKPQAIYGSQDPRRNPQQSPKDSQIQRQVDAMRLLQSLKLGYLRLEGEKMGFFSGELMVVTHFRGLSFKILRQNVEAKKDTNSFRGAAYRLMGARDSYDPFDATIAWALEAATEHTDPGEQGNGSTADMTGREFRKLSGEVTSSKNETYNALIGSHLNKVTSSAKSRTDGEQHYTSHGAPRMEICQALSKWNLLRELAKQEKKLKGMQLTETSADSGPSTGRFGAETRE